MTIVKQGTDLSKAIACPACSCEFTYLPGEVNQGTAEIYNVPPEFRKYHGGDYGPCEVGSYSYVNCPNCKSKIKL